MHSSFRDSVMPEIATLEHYKQYSILFIFLLISGTGCSDLSEYDTGQIRTAMNDSLLVTTESWDVEMILMQEGNTKLLIEGSYAINYQSEERKFSRIEGPVYVQIFDSTGALETEAWSKRAMYLENEAEFELIDSVRVHTRDDGYLYSQYLKWSQYTDRITSPSFVTIITKTDSIAGRGFDGLTDLSYYIIQEPTGDFVVD